MDVVEGFLFLLIIFEFIAIFIGGLLLLFVYAILSCIKNRNLRLAVIVLVVALFFIWFTGIDASMLLLLSLGFAVPMAVLIPPFVFPRQEEEKTGLDQILICFVIVSAVGIFLPFITVFTGLSMIPFIYWHTPLSNGVVLFAAMILYTSLAFVIYRALNRNNIVSTGDEED